MIKTSKYSAFVKKNKGNKKAGLKTANALYLELLNFGVQMSPDLFDRVSSQKNKKAKKIAKELSKEFSIGNVNRPLFTNWEDRTFFSLGEMMVQICGYSLQLSGNDFDNEGFVEGLKRNVDASKVKTLELATKKDLKEYAKKRLGAKVSLDRASSRKLEKVFDELPMDVVSEAITSDEVRIAALLYYQEEVGLTEALRGLNCKPADALRYTAGKRDFDLVKLPSDVLYANLSWSERVALFSFLDGFNFEFLCEGMGMNRGAWKKFLMHTHFLSQKGFLNRFQNFYTAAFVSLGNRFDTAPTSLNNVLMGMIGEGTIEETDGGTLAYRTFASRMNTAIESKNFKAIETLCNKRKGYLMRNLTSVMNGIKSRDRSKFVRMVRGFLPETSPDILFSLLRIDSEAQYRVIDIKGKTVVEEANYGEIFDDIQKDIKKVIKSRFGLNGKVAVDKELKNQVVPFTAKNANLARGSRIKVKKDNVFFFMHWVQDQFRTDLDHSYVYFDKDWKAAEVAFYHQANDFLTHGGDITSAPAPNGATEYGKIRINDIPENIKYIAPAVNVYSGEKFDKLKEARAGFWDSDADKFTLSSDATYYDLDQPAEANIPFVYDVENREMIVIDYNSQQKRGLVAMDYADDIRKIVMSTQTTNYVSIGDLAKMLSNDGEEVLRISNKKGKNRIAPEDLFSLFNEG